MGRPQFPIDPSQPAAQSDEFTSQSRSPSELVAIYSRDPIVVVSFSGSFAVFQNTAKQPEKPTIIAKVLGLKEVTRIAIHCHPQLTPQASRGSDCVLT